MMTMMKMSTFAIAVVAVVAVVDDDDGSDGRVRTELIRQKISKLIKVWNLMKLIIIGPW